ncbi:nucleotide exchange factor GrpE [Actinospongicola halichondriae]|uniref:nucleotide exchange factor GrpE n=1 Tax=Actinospongicola halichondriae TaxID=3236844 RepID=UPI003D487891
MSDEPTDEPTEEPSDDGSAEPAAEAEEVDFPDIEVDLEAPAEITVGQLDALVAERDQFLDAYQRAAADFDNFRKLSQKRIADEVARTQGSFVERLLPVLDAIDAARAQGHEHDRADVEAVAAQLYGFLEKEGLERVDPVGAEFDPNVAEAVVHEPGDPDDERDQPVVTEVLRTGYQWNGRVIRPAMVKVAG